MTAALALLRAHWPIAAALVLGVLLGWMLFHPRQPAVHEAVTERATETAIAKVDTRVTAAPEHEVIAEKFACPPALASAGVSASTLLTPQLVERVTTIDRGKVVTDTHAVAEDNREQDRHLDLTITPPAAPGWAVQVGFEDVLHARTFRIAARRRIVGPFWAELAVSPASHGVGVAAAVEW